MMRPGGMETNSRRSITGAHRIGLIVPSTNTVAESDFWRHSPESVTVHTSRMYLEETDADNEREMVLSHLPAAARDLSTARPDVVVFSCTSAGAVIGAEAERQLIADIGETCRAPVVSTNAAVGEAIQALGITRVAVVTAYIEDLTQRVADGIAARGIDVVQARGMGILDPFAIADVRPAEIVRFVKDNISPMGIDGVFVSCTNLRAFEVREELEAWLKVPVVTSNQAALDAAVEVLHGRSSQLARRG